MDINNLLTTEQKITAKEKLDEIVKFYTKQISIYESKNSDIEIFSLVNELRGHLCLFVNLGVLSLEEFSIHEKYIDCIKNCMKKILNK